MDFFCAPRRTTLGAFAQPCMHACNLGSGLVTTHVYCNQRDATPSQCATKGCLSKSHAHTGWQNPSTPQQPPSQRDTWDPCALIASVPRHSSSLAGAGALAVRPVEDAQRPVTFRSFLLQHRLVHDPACLRLARRVLGSLQPVFQGNQSCLHTCNGCLVLDNLFPCFALLLGCLLRGPLCPGLAATCHRLLNGI